MDDGKTRCSWAGATGGLMREYHDTEWGVPTHGNRQLFELLCLEGAQAGLSWNTILNRREGYREAFEEFDIERMAAINDAHVNKLLADARIIRNRAKVRAFVDNAVAALRLRDGGTSLNELLWSFTGGRTLVNGWTEASDVPAQTDESVAMSKALKKLGFRFVGPTICYAFMQSAGMVNDHLASCFRYTEVQAH